MQPNFEKPEWVPPNAGMEYATIIRPGVELVPADHVAAAQQTPQRRNLSIQEYLQGIRQGDRTILGRAISLVESNSLRHLESAQELLTLILPFTGHSFRIGISGAPGAGKSTFIESLGCYLTQLGHKVAVLAVDPSSSISKGSVLGDKTRMEKLVQEPNCFIRPSPSGGALGGVARKTRETVLLCEAAGYEIILIETVGVGQSEIQVRSMVDFFLLLNIPGAGDELQGIKKGIMEIADAVVINKADGDNIPKAKLAQAEYTQALQYIQPATMGWKSSVHLCSSLLNQGISEIWQEILKFQSLVQQNGFFEKRRKEQLREWIHQLIQEYLYNLFYQNSEILQAIPGIKQDVFENRISPTNAARKLIQLLQK